MINLQPITDYKQISCGDLLLIEKHNGMVFPATAKKIVNNGESDGEEVIYCLGKNWYFITRMILDGTSCYIKNVSIVKDGKATSVINNMNEHH